MSTSDDKSENKTLSNSQISPPWKGLITIVVFVFVLFQIHPPGHRPQYIDQMVQLQKAALAFASDHDGNFPETITQLIGTEYLKDDKTFNTLFDSERLQYIRPTNSISALSGWFRKDTPLMVYSTENVYMCTTISIAGKIRTQNIQKK